MPNTNPLSQTQFLQQATSLGLTPTQANDLWEAIEINGRGLLPLDTRESPVSFGKMVSKYQVFWYNHYISDARYQRND